MKTRLCLLGEFWVTRARPWLTTDVSTAPPKGGCQDVRIFRGINQGLNPRMSDPAPTVIRNENEDTNSGVASSLSVDSASNSGNNFPRDNFLAFKGRNTSFNLWRRWGEVVMYAASLAEDYKPGKWIVVEGDSLAVFSIWRLPFPAISGRGVCEPWHRFGGRRTDLLPNETFLSCAS